MNESEKECIISIKNIKSEDEEGETSSSSEKLEDKSLDNENPECSNENVSNISNTLAQNVPSPVGSIKSPDCSADDKNLREIDQAIITQEQEVDPIDLYRKLEIIKEIKNKTIYLQRIKSKISQEVDCIESESKALIDFKTELDLLVQEEKAHLEELRQIQNDMSMIENTIKQTNEEKFRALESAKRLHHDYKPLKEHINHLRDSIGLDRTDDNDDEVLIETFLKKLSPDGKMSKNSSHHHHHHHNREKSTKNSDSSHRQKNTKHISNKDSISNHKDTDFHVNNIKSSSIQGSSNNSNTQNTQVNEGIPVQLATAALMAHSLRSLSPNSLSQQHHNFQQHFNPFILNQVNINNEKFKNNNSNINNNVEQVNNQIYQHQQQQQQHQQLQSLPPPFRQQPPPMKTCLSCNQQIHRNAPICPLCKAKSRSTNPKKPKKKNAINDNNTSPPEARKLTVSSKNY